MVIPNNTPDVEPKPLDPPTPGTGLTPARPRWWRRAVAYSLRRGADRLQRTGRRRTAAGEGRSLVRERRQRIIGGASA